LTTVTPNSLSSKRPKYTYRSRYHSSVLHTYVQP
jgi:hypothetical protein